MRVGILGPVSVDGDAERLARRERVVLAALALEVDVDGAVSADRLREVLWGDEPPASSTKIVQGCVVRLRKVLGAGAIETTADGYRLNVAADAVDARRLERLVHRGQQLLTLDEPDRAAHTLTEALSLWRGRPLAELDGWDRARIERERLEELRREAEELRIAAALRAGHHREVLLEAQRLVADAPLRERRWGLLARALYQVGRQPDALATLHRARVLLRAELGLDPGPELEELQQRILQQDPDLAVDAAADGARGTCPYQGLVPYDVDDADDYFGRDADVEACLQRVATTGMLAVVGPSGSGKSSLVRAGVAAHLRRQGRAVVVVTPGPRPMDALTAVPSGGRSPALVVDQCEEAVTLCDDPGERRRFFAALIDHADRAPLVIALRADRVGEMSHDVDAATIVERGLHLLRPMGAEALRDAIEGPAGRAGLLLEPGLVDVLVREVEHEAGGLPLLSHALRATWERREGRTLTVDGYMASGGIHGAVAQTAEALHDDLEPAQRAVLRSLLLRLVVQTPEGTMVRARLHRRMLVEDPAHAELVELLVAQRLLTSTDTQIELAHEAVTRAWPRLREWLADDAAGQRILRHLSTAADTWDEMGRPASELYRGTRLAAALQWRDQAEPRLTPVERDFLDAGASLADAERREAEQRARRQARTNRRLRLLLGGVGVLSIVAVLAGLLAMRQARRADAAAETAETAATAADARRVSAQALITQDIDRSLLLAVEGLRLDDSPDTRASLLAALGRSPELVGVIRGEGDGVFGRVSVSPDGRTLAVYDDANRMWFHDVETGAVRGSYRSDEFHGFADNVTGHAVFHPDGEVVAVTVSTGGARPVRLLDARTLRELPVQPELPRSQYLAWDVAFSPDGSRLAVVADKYRHHRLSTYRDESFVYVWNMDAPAAPVATLEVPLYAHGLAFSPDGRQLYVGAHAAPPAFTAEPGITVHDIESGGLVRTLPAPSHPFALSPDGSTIAAPAAAPGSSDAAGAEIVLVDAVTGDERRRLRGHTAQVLDVAFSSDGTRLASASQDRSVIVWDAATGRRREQLRGHASAVASVTFHDDGATLYSAGHDRAVLTWDLDGQRRFVPASTPVGSVEGLGQRSLYGLYGRLESYAVVAPHGDAVARVWYEFPDEGIRGVRARRHALMQVIDVARSRVGPVIDSGHDEYLALAWHPDGRRFVTTGWDGNVRVWTPGGQTPSAEQNLENRRYEGVAYVDGGRLVLSQFGGLVYTVDAESLQPDGDRFAVPASTMSGATSPDGRTVAVVTSDGVELPHTRNVFTADDRLLLVDVDDRRVRHQLDLGFDGEWADFSPDGARVAVTSRGGQVAVVDVATGEMARRAQVGHDGNVVSVDYAPDGRTIASGGEDGRISLWDGVTGTLLGSVPVEGPNARVFVGFRPDGHTLTAATWSGRIHTLDTRSTHWIDIACDIAGRNLTRVEWREAFGDRPYRPACRPR